MNKSKLIWGIICLVIAGGLAFLILADLPSVTVSFMIEGVNRPWVPTIVVAIIGIALLATANQSKAEKEKEEIDVDPDKAALNKNIERVAWGAFLILLGCFMFRPEWITKGGGWWSIGVGLIFLGLNAARYFNGLRMSGFTTFLGIISVVGGVLDLIGVEGITGPILFIVLGGYLILKPYFDKRQLFGKAEQ